MIDRAGQVVATVFAAITGSPGGQGGFAVPNALVAAQLAASESRTHPVSTQPCAEIDARTARSELPGSGWALWAGGGLHTARP